MNKQLLIPIAALFVLVLKQYFGYELTDETIDVVTNAMLAIVTLMGIFMHPKGK